MNEVVPLLDEKDSLEPSLSADGLVFLKKKKTLAT